MFPIKTLEFMIHRLSNKICDGEISEEIINKVKEEFHSDDNEPLRTKN